MARGKIQSWVEQGANTVLTDGRTSTTRVQRSFPSATVTVFNGGTVVLATIFSDEAGTSQANPFVADSNGFYSFWADQGRYDIRFSGGGLATPFTIFTVEPVISATGLADPGGNGYVVRVSPSATIARSIQGTTSEIVVTNGNGVSGVTTISLDTSLNFTGKTIIGGTFNSPAIANFSNAVHNHESLIGGGQLNASNIFSSGTVPVARLPIMVGATGVSAGTPGLVPAPAAGEQNLFLRGDGTWQAAGGGGGTPGSPSLSVQYNNAGAFGGITGSSSDGTQVTFTAGVLRATSPRFTTSILDTNGNEIIGLSATGSAVNEITVSNAAAGSPPGILATGGDTDINLNISGKGTGLLHTVSNFRIQNNAPSITMIDDNDSKTFRLSLSGGTWAVINDTIGQNAIEVNTVTNGITIPALTTFNTIPVGPASDPTTANQLTRKSYVDARRTAFSINFYEFDPNGFTLSTEDRPGFIVPDGANIIITKLRICYLAGSHTTGGTLSYIVRRHANGRPADIDLGTVTLDNTNDDIRITYTNDIGDIALASGDIITYYMSARTGTITERAVTINVTGTQTLA